MADKPPWTTLRERRYLETVTNLARAVTRRDKIITDLVRQEAKLKELRRQFARYEKLANKPAEPKPEPPEPKPEPVEAIEPKSTAIVDKALDDMPDFLNRRKQGTAKDDAARAAILAEQEERKRNKSRVRAEERKAKQAGLTRRMPLTGKAALAAIRKGA
jgi:hypothetical protein